MLFFFFKDWGGKLGAGFFLFWEGEREMGGEKGGGRDCSFSSSFSSSSSLSGRYWG